MSGASHSPLSSIGRPRYLTHKQKAEYDPTLLRQLVLTVMRRIDSAFRLFEGRLILNSLAWFIGALLMYGIGGYPFQDYFRMAQNPYVKDLKASFYQDSILLPLVSHLFGLHTSLAAFLFFCGAVLFGAIVVYAALAQAQYGRELASFVPAILMLHPLSIALLNWLGSPDGFTLAMSGIIALSQSPGAVLGAAFLGTMNHPQMLLIAPMLGALRLASLKSRSAFRTLVYLVLGCGIGYGTVRLFLWLYQIDISFNRTDFVLSRDLSYWWNLKLAEFPVSLFSLYGGLWIVLLVYVTSSYKYDRPYYTVFLVMQVACSVITLFTWDTTRVFGLLTIASTVHCILTTLTLAKRNSLSMYITLSRLLIAALVLAVFLPKSVAWYGHILPALARPFWREASMTALQLMNRILVR
jgi:hypothetical protein